MRVFTRPPDLHQQSFLSLFFVGHVDREDVALPEERRRRMFEAEARAVMSEGLDAASAKSTLEVGRIVL